MYSFILQVLLSLHLLLVSSAECRQVSSVGTTPQCRWWGQLYHCFATELLMWHFCWQSFSVGAFKQHGLVCGDIARFEILWESGTGGKDADAISSYDSVKFCAIELVIFTQHYHLTLLILGMFHSFVKCGTKK